MWLLFSNMLVSFLFKFPLKQHEMQNNSWFLFENNSDASLTIALDWFSWCDLLNPVIWILSFSSRGVTAATTLSINVKQHQQLWSLPMNQVIHYKHLVLISLKFMKVTTGKTACYTFFHCTDHHRIKMSLQHEQITKHYFINECTNPQRTNSSVSLNKIQHNTQILALLLRARAQKACWNLYLYTKLEDSCHLCNDRITNQTL